MVSLDADVDVQVTVSPPVIAGKAPRAVPVVQELLVWSEKLIPRRRRQVSLTLLRKRRTSGFTVEASTNDHCNSD